MKYVLLCYDVRKNGLRSKLYKYLLSIDGIPVQKSVFIIPHNHKNRKAKIDWIRVNILPKLSPTDQIHVVPLNKEMIDRIESIQSVVDLSFMQDAEITLI